MGGGALQTTGNTFDVAISGEGWFRVGSSTAPAVPTALEYTRAGNFTTNDQGYLTTQDGQYVLGRTAPGGAGTDTLIQIAPAAGNVSIGQDGSVSYQPTGGGARVTAGYLSLAKFENQPAWSGGSNERLGGGQNTGLRAGEHPLGGVYGITDSGALEMSNVDLAAEFTNMITAQRGFQANSRVISTADQMLQDLVNLIR